MMTTEEISLHAVKRCTACRQEKPLVDFGADFRRRDGCASKCRGCAAAVTRRYYERYPEKEAAKRLKQAALAKQWYQRNREAQIARFRWAHLLKKYGLTREDYEKMLAAQGGGCAICETTDPGRSDQHFAVDHNHVTGKVRGLLCQRCNSGLGFFADAPERLRKAASYVQERK